MVSVCMQFAGGSEWLKVMWRCGLDIQRTLISIECCHLQVMTELLTYLKTRILVNSIGFRDSYFSLMLQGATALFNLAFTAAMLRWAALKDSGQGSGGRSRMRLGWLNRQEPHVHVSFFLDMLPYIGLLILNLVPMMWCWVWQLLLHDYSV